MDTHWVSTTRVTTATGRDISRSQTRKRKIPCKGNSTMIGMFDACIDVPLTHAYAVAHILGFLVQLRSETIPGVVSSSHDSLTHFVDFRFSLVLTVTRMCWSCCVCPPNPLSLVDSLSSAKCKRHDGFGRSRTRSVTDSTPFDTKRGLLERKKNMGEPDLTA